MRKLNVKELTLLLIAVLMVVSGWRAGYGRVLPQVAVAALVAVVIDSAAIWFRQRKAAISVAGLITALIVAGVAAPGTAWWAVAAMAALAIGSKHLIKRSGRNVFNPAAFGLFIGTVLLGVQMSWWVDHWHELTIALGAVLLANFTGRWRLVLSFLVPYAALLVGRAYWLGMPALPELFLSFSIASFFAFFMLTDPRTEPIMPRHLPWFGLVVAVVTFLSVVFFPSTIFLAGLLVANVVAFGLNVVALRPKPAPHPPTTTVTPAANQQ